ncbi:MAG: DUF2520 domain-containing protein [Sphingobacteriales bacterium]|nr:DUF2520 domain-containing protein [Sphingobacteriales bacterium]
MDIVIIGSGNVAAVLGRKFKAAGHKIVQILSRNAKAASELAYEWDTESTNYKSTINKQADVYIIAVSDDAIPEVTEDLKLPGKVVAHTAASVPKEVLKNVTAHYGVFYPLQSLRTEMTSLPEIPLYVDGNDEETRTKLSALARSISPEQVAEAGNEDRAKLHLAAVLVSNFTNHLYKLAADYCQEEGLDFRQLVPLIEETALRLKEISPKDAQTGPATRHDRETIQKHLELLNAHPQLKEIYLLMTHSIQQGD